MKISKKLLLEVWKSLYHYKKELKEIEKNCGHLVKDTCEICEREGIYISYPKNNEYLTIAVGHLQEGKYNADVYCWDCHAKATEQEN